MGPCGLFLASKTGLGWSLKELQIVELKQQLWFSDFCCLFIYRSPVFSLFFFFLHGSFCITQVSHARMFEPLALRTAVVFLTAIIDDIIL